MSNKPKHLRHTIKVIESGEVEIETLSFTKKRFRLTGHQLHLKLKELAGWEPADRFGHVMNQLAKGRVYQIEPRRGDGVEFVDLPVPPTHKSKLPRA